MKCCRKATQLISESMDSRLSLGKTISLKVHLWICTICTRYEAQINFIRHLTGVYKKKLEESGLDSTRLAMPAREKMKQVMKEKT